jgi:hypothetical protein
MQYLLLWCHLCHGRPSPPALQHSHAVTACLTVSGPHPQAARCGRSRVISIDDETVAVLRQRKADQAAEQLKAGDSWRGTKDGYAPSGTSPGRSGPSGAVRLT